MDAVLFVGHGTREEEGIAEFYELTERVARQVNAKRAGVPLHIEHCFLELRDPDIETGIDECRKQGAERILLAPVFLFSAGHLKRDLPRAMERAAHASLRTELRLGEAIGADPQMADVVVERLQAAGVAAALRQGADEVTVLLVGRGSRDPEARQDFEAVVNCVRARIANLHIVPCFLTGLGTPFAVALADCTARYVFIAPYLLFTGRLMQEIEQKAAEYRLACLDKEVTLLAHLGVDDAVVQRFAEKTLQALAAK